MEPERLYRLSIPGIVFLSSILLFYLLRGGYIDSNLVKINESTITTLIAIIITAPVLGIFISTITQVIIIFYGYRFFINKPKDTIINIVLEKDDELKNKLSENNLSKNTLREFYLKYQTYIRINFNDETIKFLQRRWNFIWIHLNNILATLLGISLSLFLKAGTETNNINKPVLYLATLALIIYIIAAIIHFISIRKEAIEIEEEAVLRCIKNPEFEKNILNFNFKSKNVKVSKNKDI